MTMKLFRKSSCEVRYRGYQDWQDAALALARRSRGTPRIANRLLRRVRDFVDVLGERTVNADRVVSALLNMQIDHKGLEPP